MSTKAASPAKPRFRVGDVVEFLFGVRRVRGSVVEDRGRIGLGGRRLYGVRIPMDPDEPSYIELPEEDLTRAADDDPPLAPDEIADYFAEGGLVSVLTRAEGPGGSGPSVWLRRDGLGNVVHTFDPDRGKVGGARVPVRALRGVQVAETQERAVRDFLEHFGLCADDVERVIAEVGVAT